jgi:uncharacterized membrane protein
MKFQNQSPLLLAFLFLAGFAGKSPASDASEIPTEVSFQEDVFPVFQSKCNQGECHGRRGKAFPKYTSYGIIKAKAKKVVYRLNKKEDPMPPKDSEWQLTAKEKQQILEWIEGGMPRN